MTPFPTCTFCHKKSEGEDRWVRAIGETAICSTCGGDLFNALRVVEDQKRKIYMERLRRAIDLAAAECRPGSVLHDAILNIRRKAESPL